MQARLVLEKYREELRRLPEVVGLATTIVNKEEVIVLLLRKRPPPGVLPLELEGVRVIHQVVGEIIPFQRTARVRPAVGGISVGHPMITAGTLGAIVSIDGKPFIISNNHVIAAVNRARIGDPIIQPGRADGGRVPDDVIGKLSGFCEIKIIPFENRIDFAYAEADPRLVENLIFQTRPGVREVPPKIYLADLRPKLAVFKSGRTTGITRGEVLYTDAEIIFFFPLVGPVVFVDLVAVRPIDPVFGARGDSGSLVLTPDGKAVGLLFAGSRLIVLVCKMTNILEWIYREFNFRQAFYTAELGWLYPVLGLSVISGGISVGARR